MLFRLGHVWFFSATARLARLSQLRGVEMRRRPCTVYIGDGCKVKHYKGEVLITLVLVLDVMPLAIIYIVACVYSKWLRVGCLIGWPRLSGYIQGIYSFSSVYILKGRAVVQSSRISALFAIYISSLVLGISFTVSWRYLSVNYIMCLYNTTQLQLEMCYRR